MSDTPVPLSTLAKPINGSSNQPKMTDWKNEPSLVELKQDFQAAKPYHDGHMARVRTWTDNLTVTGGAAIKPRQGRSSVQPKLIRKQAEWRYAPLSESVLSSEDLFRVKPVGAQDIASARQNSLLLNYQFRVYVDKVTFIDNLTRDMVDLGTAAVRVGWFSREEERTYEQPVYQYFPIQAGTQEAEEFNAALRIASETPDMIGTLDPLMIEALEYFSETQQPNYVVQSGVEEVKVMEVVENYPTVELIDIENLYVDPSCGNDYRKARFMAYSFETSYSELKKDARYKNLDKVDWNAAAVIGSTPAHSPQYKDTTFNFRDKERKRVVAVEMWALWDIEGNGVLKPILATWIGETCVRMEENPLPDGMAPFEIIPMMPIRGTFYGEPDGELLADNQKIIGAITRGMIDIMARSANGQMGMAKNMLDLPNQRRFERGEDYYYNPNVNPQIGIIEHKFPEIPGSAMSMLQMVNMESESLVGVMGFNRGLNSNSLGQVAAGIRGAMDAVAQREMSVIRRMSNGLKKIGERLLSMNQAFLTKEEVVQVTENDFVPVSADEIQGKFNLEVDLSSAEADVARAQELAFMLQTLGNNADWGMMQMVLVEIAYLRKMPGLAKKLEKYQPQQDPLAQQKAMLEIEVLKAELEKIRSETQENLAQAKRHNALADQANLDFVEQETGTKHARDVDKVTSQGRANERLEILKTRLANGSSRLTTPVAGSAGRPRTNGSGSFPP